MSATSRCRGHLTVYVGDAWVYADTRQPVSLNPDRPCVKCGMASTDDGPDACLGRLPGVDSACCGHGVQEAYAKYSDGRIVRGQNNISGNGAALMAVKQTQEQFIRQVLRAAGVPNAKIEADIEALRRESGHKLDEPCPLAATVGGS